MRRLVRTKFKNNENDRKTNFRQRNHRPFQPSEEKHRAPHKPLYGHKRGWQTNQNPYWCQGLSAPLERKEANAHYFDGSLRERQQKQ